MFKEAARFLSPSSKIGYKLPDPEWFWQFEIETKHTPDIAKLSEYEFQLVFVSDDLQVGHKNYSFLENSAFICPAFTQKSFNYWKPEIPGLPMIPMESESNFQKPLPFYPDPAKIKGEVHAVRPYQMIPLDKFMENGVQFTRHRIRLIVPYRAVVWLKDKSVHTNFEFQGRSIATTEECVYILRAWMYIGEPSYWDGLISAYDFSKVPTYTSKNRAWCPKYYQIKR